jgi:peptidyl-prolyl cis-trans isomerase D
MISMLDVFRNSAKGTAGKVIVGLIVITFVFFGADSIMSIVGNTSPATVNGEDISNDDYQRLLSSRQQELTSQFGAEVAAQLANSPFLKEEIIESLVSQKLQTQMVSQLDFDVSEDQVLKTFADIPAFQIDGKFDQDMYQNILAANGFNHQSFVDAQKKQIALTQMQAGIANSAFSVTKVVDRYASLNAQTRDLRYKQFSAEDYLDKVQLTDDELNQHYLDNDTQYLSEEQVKVKYIKLTLEELAQEIDVTDSDLQSAYDSYLASLASQETREISHILFADGDDATSEAEDAMSRLQAGESFAELAIELSDDPGSAEFGGSLGVLIPDVYVPEFYDAAIALNEEGQVSDLVTTQYGIHLIRLDALSTETPKTLDEMRSDLVAEIKLQKATDEMVIVQSQFSDESFAADYIEDVADVFQAEVLESDWITRSGNSAEFSEASAIEAAFSSQVIDDGLISNVVRLSSGDLLAVQKLEYQPEDIKPFESVIDEVTASLTQIKASELMRSDLEAVLANSQSFDDSWTEVSALTRDSSEVPVEVVSKAFEMPVPSTSITDGSDTAYVIALERSSTPEPSGTYLQLARDFVDQASGGSQYQMVYNQARESANIKFR